MPFSNVFQDLFTTQDVTNEMFIGKFSFVKNVTIQIQKSAGVTISDSTFTGVFGFVRKGIVVAPNQILVGRVRIFKTVPLAKYGRLQFDVLELKQRRATIGDVSFRMSCDLIGRVLNFDGVFVHKFIRLEISNIKDIQNKRDIIDDFPFSIPNDFDFPTFALCRKKMNKVVVLQKAITEYREFCSFFYPIGRELQNYHLTGHLLAAGKSYCSIYFTSRLICATNRISRNFARVFIVLATHHRVQFGDKLTGSDGNKGIVTRLIFCSDTPCFINGVSLDIILDTMGVPSRINVGQIHDARLGFSGFYSGEQYLFDLVYCEKNWGMGCHRFVLEKLRVVSVLTRYKWIFNPKILGKFLLTDTRAYELIEKPTITGESHFMKLTHMVGKKT